MHVSIEACVNVVASHLIVTAPETSPNTDGIHVASTRDMQIMNCMIGTGKLEKYKQINTSLLHLNYSFLKFHS